MRIRSVQNVSAVQAVRVVLGLFLASAGWINLAEAAGPAQMKFFSFLGPTHPMTSHIQDLLKELAEASNGTVVIDYHGAEPMLCRAFRHATLACPS